MDTQQIIKLNIGGITYTTTTSTLLKYPYTKLGQIFGLDNTTTGRHGRVFIDRDGHLFRFILNFLRTGQLLLPDDFQEISLLKAEVEFYSIPELTKAIEDWKSKKTLTVEERVFVQTGRRHPGSYVDWTIQGARGTVLWLSEIDLFCNNGTSISNDGHKLHRSWYNDIRIGATESGYQYGYCNPVDPIQKESILKEITSLGYRLKKKLTVDANADINEFVKAFVHFNAEKSHKYIFDMFK